MHMYFKLSIFLSGFLNCMTEEKHCGHSFMYCNYRLVFVCYMYKKPSNRLQMRFKCWSKRFARQYIVFFKTAIIQIINNNGGRSNRYSARSPVRLRVRQEYRVSRLSGRSCKWDHKTRGPLSQQVWHDKRPSCSNAISAEQRPKLRSPFTGNCYVSIWM